MSTRTAILFPGQGSQHPSMAAAAVRDDPELVALAERLLDVDPFKHLDDGTQFVQVAVFCASLASWNHHRGDFAADVFAGHSLGELTALVAAEALAVSDALQIVELRGRLTQEVADAHPGGMLALLGAKAGLAQELALRSGATIANDNAPGQVVLSGTDEALRKATELADRWSIRERRLDVNGAFHSPLMAPAAEAFATALAEIPVSRPCVPVYSCVTARPFEDIRAGLVDSLTRPVRWRETVEAIVRTNVRAFVEVAPGKVLSGLGKRITPGMRYRHLDLAA